jgi:hypothetical protein
VSLKTVLGSPEAIEAVVIVGGRFVTDSKPAEVPAPTRTVNCIPTDRENALAALIVEIIVTPIYLT